MKILFPAIPLAGSRANTLIEVVFALAILATVMVSLMGMLSRGFGTIRKAADLATEIRIARLLQSEVQEMNWENAVALADSNRFFDDQGMEIEADDHRRIYVAKVIVDPYGAADAVLPGDTAADISRSGDLRRVVVRISAIPGPRGIEALSGAGRPGDFHDFAALIARIQRKPAPAMP